MIFKTLAVSKQENVTSGSFAFLHLASHINTALQIEELIGADKALNIKFAFLSFDEENEAPATKEQYDEVAGLFAIVFNGNMPNMVYPAPASEQSSNNQINHKTIPDTRIVYSDTVSAPDYDKLADTIKDGSAAYSMSVIIKKYTNQWKSYVARDLCGLIQIRNVLSENIEADYKLADKDGKMVLYDSISIKPSLIFDFKIYETGIIEPEIQPFSGDLIMNVIDESDL